ncbi:unnamed protein product [Penicillium nalgiovense]|nr:unnamed protein product [Penicillium nalgiovense]
MAVNDAALLESSVFAVVKSELSSHTAYVDMIKAFHEAAFNTQLGQLCDLISPGR